MPFAEKLKLLRHQNNMTQADVADRLNVARSTIAGYEKKGRQPSQENLIAFARLFDVSVDYLVDAVEDPTIENSEVINLDSSQCTLRSDDEKELVIRYRNLSPRAKLS